MATRVTMTVKNVLFAPAPEATTGGGEGGGGEAGFVVLGAFVTTTVSTAVRPEDLNTATISAALVSSRDLVTDVATVASFTLML